MYKERILTQQDFDQLLAWLDSDREAAGRKYESIRLRLIKIFTCRGCYEAEDMADETINRVSLKVHEIMGRYVGDPALYFYGVAHKVHLEYSRKKATRAEMPAVIVSSEATEEEPEYECLEQCIQQLPAKQRELVLQYYQEEARAKIDHRKEQAQKLGIALNALRIRAHRIRATLQECVRNCLEQNAAG